MKPKLILLAFTAAILITVTQNPTTPAQTSDQDARSAYATGDFTLAAKLFAQSAKDIDPTIAALSLGNLSLCYQQLGQWDKAETAIATALTKFANLDAPSQAQLLDIQASLRFNQGDATNALAQWQQAERLSGKMGDRLQLRQAQALQQLGLHRTAIDLLLKKLNFSDPKLFAQQLQKTTADQTPALQILAESYRATDKATIATQILERGLALSPNDSSLQLTLANTIKTADRPTALKLYQAAEAAGSDRRLPALVGQFDLGSPDALSKLQTLLSKTPPSRTTIETQIHLAQTLVAQQNHKALPLLETAVSEAKKLGDPRLQSYALGLLGQLYELEGKIDRADRYTSEAITLAETVGAPEISYRWQWQMARIFKAQGKSEPAIQSYKNALQDIRSLRADLVSASPEAQFTFRDAVEPIHRELVKSLLQSGITSNLQIARDVIESLQFVELENFFREACLTATENNIETIDRNAAVIYPIILGDQLAVISSLPGEAGQPRTLKYYSTAIEPSDVFNEKIDILRGDLSQGNTSDLALPTLRELYELLMGPVEADLAARKVETLVFVLDGVLRNVPMAALYDGKSYLVEKYRIALTPGLQLLSPKPLNATKIGALVLGLDQAQSNFSALPYVKTEIQNIQKILPTQTLYNDRFTNNNFQTTVNDVSYPIVHLATHGQFANKADDTFILTWQGKLKINTLSDILKTGELTRSQPLELLVLSACETAKGDGRSALGLAGVAVRSGARSTVATLWRVNDQASAVLMGRFYEELSKIGTTKISKAEALRRAQLSVLRDPAYRQQPYFWAPYLLIGNWT
jgi:CHAT domain-containing protein/predicted Zn-dependent protease